MRIPYSSLVLLGLLSACMPTTNRPTPAAIQPAPASDILWARKDGQRMSTNPELYQQGLVDKQYCEQEASTTGQLDFKAFASCMNRSGYVQMRSPG